VLSRELNNRDEKVQDGTKWITKGCPKCLCSLNSHHFALRRNDAVGRKVIAKQMLPQAEE